MFEDNQETVICNKGLYQRINGTRIIIMEIKETSLKDCLVIKPKVIEDSRGFFFEGFNAAGFERLTGMSGNFVQDNQSYSNYGVIRGLHA